jgi:hypothetical protein
MPNDQFVRGIPRGITYTDEGLRRIANAAWDIQHLLPHPDDEKTWAAEIREFHRALQNLQPLEQNDRRRDP